MRPFCDGTHQLVRFKAPSQPEQARPADSDSVAAPRSNGAIASATHQDPRPEAGAVGVELGRARNALSELIASTHELAADEELAGLVEQLVALVIVLQARLQPA